MARVFMFLRLFRRDLIVMLLALKNPATPRRVKYLMALAAPCEDFIPADAALSRESH